MIESAVKSAGVSASEWVRETSLSAARCDKLWALFKRGYHGIYHQMSRKHLQRYLDEFMFRFNNRPGTMQEFFSDVVTRITEATKLPYKASEPATPPKKH